MEPAEKREIDALYTQMADELSRRIYDPPPGYTPPPLKPIPWRLRLRNWAYRWRTRVGLWVAPWLDRED
jgi:hypothetical protein